MTRIYSYTLKLSAFLLRGRGGARFRGRWIYRDIVMLALYNIYRDIVMLAIQTSNVYLGMPICQDVQGFHGNLIQGFHGEFKGI